MFFFHRPSFAEAEKKARADAAGVFLDVRTREEYAEGHLPGAVNIPLDELGGANFGRDRHFYVYCRSGARSARAAGYLKRRGFFVVDLGGIAGYAGELERGSDPQKEEK